MPKLAVLPESRYVESVENAKSLLSDYKAKYGSGSEVILIDQAIRLVDHFTRQKGEEADQQLDSEVIDDAMSIAFEIETAALDVSLHMKDKESREKYEIVNEIVSDLRVLLQCES